jgi:predicted site-specific integrase-resolvase
MADHTGYSVVHLRRLANEGKLQTQRTEGGHRRFIVNGESHVVVYCRVSTSKQKDDLERQVEKCLEAFPSAEVIKEVGSGMRFHRKGLQTLLERCSRGEQLTVVVAYRDRLSRFSYDAIKWIIEKAGGKIVVLHESGLSEEQRLCEDLLAICHCFSCSIHGKRGNAKSKDNKIVSKCLAETDT